MYIHKSGSPGGKTHVSACVHVCVFQENACVHGCGGILLAPAPSAPSLAYPGVKHGDVKRCGWL